MDKKTLTGKIFIIAASAILLINSYSAAYSVTADWTRGKIIVSGQSAILTDNTGRPIDHETGIVISISEAAARAFERAKDMAFSEAVLRLKDLRVDNHTFFSDLINTDPVVRQRFSELLNSQTSFREVYIDYLTRGCVLEINTGELIRAVNFTFPDRDFPMRSDMEISTHYTSLIIDTRGLGVKPMLLPVVYNESGLEVYSKNYINAGEAVKHNVVSYVYNEKDALKHRKAGGKPFFTVAIKESNGSPVISDDDIKRIFSHKKNLDYLKRCRVIFIIDR